MGPTSRRDLIAALRPDGFEGPWPHEFMSRGDTIIWIPNPHGSDIGRELLVRMLRQAGITCPEWEAL